MPKLTWYGHSCFKLDFGESGTVIFDPYAPGSVPGVELPPELEADLVLCSHAHGDHNAAERVRLSGKAPKLGVELLDSFHDDEQGGKRGQNRIAIVSDGSFRAAHLGDLGCALTAEQLQALGGVDLLLLPVGGFFTIGPEQAEALCRAVQPRVVVPMHYRRGELGFAVLHTLEDFTGRFEAWTELSGNELDLQPECSGLYVLRV